MKNNILLITACINLATMNTSNTLSQAIEQKMASIRLQVDNLYNQKQHIFVLQTLYKQAVLFLDQQMNTFSTITQNIQTCYANQCNKLTQTEQSFAKEQIAKQQEYITIKTVINQMHDSFTITIKELTDLKNNLITALKYMKKTTHDYHATLYPQTLRLLSALIKNYETMLAKSNTSICCLNNTITLHEQFHTINQREKESLLNELQDYQKTIACYQQKLLKHVHNLESTDN